MTINELRILVSGPAEKYSVKKIILFGSRASGSNRADSDVDLIVEFQAPVTLIMLSQMKLELEEILNLKVDLIHGPITENDMIEIKDEVLLYAA